MNNTQKSINNDQPTMCGSCNKQIEEKLDLENRIKIWNGYNLAFVNTYCDKCANEKVLPFLKSITNSQTHE